MLELREKSLHFDEYKFVIKSLIGHPLLLDGRRNLWIESRRRFWIYSQQRRLEYTTSET